MVKIRLARSGAKKRPFYHVVATDSRNRRDGRYIERLGFFNPVARGKEVPLSLKVERIDYWKAQGAQVSERVTSLIRSYDPSQLPTPEAKPKAATVEAAPEAVAEIKADEAKEVDAKAAQAEAVEAEETKVEAEAGSDEVKVDDKTEDKVEAADGADANTEKAEADAEAAPATEEAATADEDAEKKAK